MSEVIAFEPPDKGEIIEVNDVDNPFCCYQAAVEELGRIDVDTALLEAIPRAEMEKYMRSVAGFFGIRFMDEKQAEFDYLVRRGKATYEDLKDWDDWDE